MSLATIKEMWKCLPIPLRNDLVTAWHIIQKKAHLSHHPKSNPLLQKWRSQWFFHLLLSSCSLGLSVLLCKRKIKTESQGRFINCHKDVKSPSFRGHVCSWIEATGRPCGCASSVRAPFRAAEITRVWTGSHVERDLVVSPPPSLLAPQHVRQTGPEEGHFGSQLIQKQLITMWHFNFQNVFHLLALSICTAAWQLNTTGLRDVSCLHFGGWKSGIKVSAGPCAFWKLERNPPAALWVLEVCRKPAASRALQLHAFSLCPRHHTVAPLFVCVFTHLTGSSPPYSARTSC